MQKTKTVLSAAHRTSSDSITQTGRKRKSIATFPTLLRYTPKKRKPYFRNPPTFDKRTRSNLLSRFSIYSFHFFCRLQQFKSVSAVLLQTAEVTFLPSHQKKRSALKCLTKPLHKVSYFYDIKGMRKGTHFYSSVFFIKSGEKQGMNSHCRKNNQGFTLLSAIKMPRHSAEAS